MGYSSGPGPLPDSIPDELRASMSRKLRALADSIDAGGQPVCYAHNIDEPALFEVWDAARAHTHCEVDYAGVWDPSPYGQEWGVMVCVERVECTYLENKLGSVALPATADYALVDPDTYSGPELGETECRACGWGGVADEDGDCPDCVATADVEKNDPVDMEGLK